MKVRSELLVADEDGLNDFLTALKRERVRAMVDFEPLPAIMASNGPRTKAHRDAEKALDLLLMEPATREGELDKLLDRTLRAWRDEQLKRIEERRIKAQENAKEMGLLAPIFGNLADAKAKKQISLIDSVSSYIGNLNREVSEARVAKYHDDMLAGKWWFTPDPIVISTEGDIINGQHRLLAAERAVAKLINNAPTFLLVWGVDKRAALLMDQAKRSTDDRRSIALKFAGSLTG